MDEERTVIHGVFELDESVIPILMALANTNTDTDTGGE